MCYYDEVGLWWCGVDCVCWGCSCVDYEVVDIGECVGWWEYCIGFVDLVYLVW